MGRRRRFTVVDLFSGAGGMSCGFARHTGFQIIGAVDVEVGKPSTGNGAIQCNGTYEANIGLAPLAMDLAATSPAALREALGLQDRNPDVLLACPPCTGFSRTIAGNHSRDDPRNLLVRRAAAFVAELQPQVVILENARELLTGTFRLHSGAYIGELKRLGYEVNSGVHLLTHFGLPQQRERAMIIATRAGHIKTLDDLWAGWRVDPKATHVRRAIYDTPEIASGETDERDPAHTSTLLRGQSLERIQAIPRDGGSWRELLGTPLADRHLTPAMWAAARRRKLNQFCDIYGRMAWDRPAPTIKRECAHPGNGRYCHPEQDRLCTVRELATLQGFPSDYSFTSRSRKNRYRNVGDAVPPLVSYQLAWLAWWILTDRRRPHPEEFLLEGTHLTSADIERVVTRKG